MPETTRHDARIFFANTRFQILAQRPGAPTREQALAGAQIQIDELKSESDDWLSQEIQELSILLKQFETTSTNDGALEHSYQKCTQLRDLGAAFGLELLTLIADNLCEILDAIKAGAPYDKDAIDCHLTSFALARSDTYRHVRLEQAPEMVSGLRRVVEHTSIAPAQKNK